MLPDLREIPEIGPVEPGQYRVQLLGLQQKVSQKSSKVYLGARVGLPDEPTADDMRLFVGFIPGEGDNSKEAIKDGNAIRDFLVGFGLPIDGSLQFDDSETPSAPAAVGCIAIATIGVKDNQGRQENYIINLQPEA